MRPEDLPSPFSWKNRSILIQDRVWYVPDYYDQYETFTFPGWHHADTFSRAQPIKVEYCSGNGAWIAAKALQDPNTNWVAVEKQFERACKIWSKLKNYQLDNLLVICGEGLAVTRHYFPSHTIQEVFVNFPDPWPKRRHAKHRIIQPPFIQEVERILQVGGKLTLVTDDELYSTRMLKVMHAFSTFDSAFPSPHFVTDLPSCASSF